MSEPSAPRRRYPTLSLVLLVLALVCLIIFTLASHGTVTTKEPATWLGAGLSFFIAAFLA